MDVTQSYNFRAINRLLTTSGEMTKADLESLKSQGYEAVINLLPNENQHALPEEQEIIESQGIEYVHIPVDWSAPTEENYRSFVKAAADTQNKKTHIHCAANWRVSAFYALYAIESNIWSAATAREHINDLWNPNDFPAWKHFLEDQGLPF